MQRHHETSAKLCEYVREQTGDTVILSFSRGKDAIAAWLQLRRYFTRIVPFFYYTIPDISFVDESLKYYEDFFGCTIERYPTPHLFRMLRNFIHQPPERCAVIESLDLAKFENQDLEQDMRERFGVPNALCALGTRTTDSMVRRTAARRYGTLNPNRRTFWPVFDWTTEDLVREFRAAKVKLPVDYEMFGRTFDGISHLYVAPLRERFPADYERVREWFPMIDLEMFRRQLSPETTP
jgi:hypothetical protein